jgi:transglutaminase-like putative cysteine protease
MEQVDLPAAAAAPSSVGCTLAFDVSMSVSVVIQVAAARLPGVRLSERIDVANNAVPLPVQELPGSHGGRQHLVHAQPGTLTVDYQATIAGNAAAPAPVTDLERVIALRPSRYCPSDRLAGFAQSHFGDLVTPAQRVEAIHGYLWEHIAYEADTSGPTTDAADTLLSGRGVCRDFAHLFAALCRAVEVPARVAAVYAPGLSPMDFHLVAETDIDGYWYVWDATRLAPRPTLMRIATGRDAADVAFATVLSGHAELRTLEISAVAGGELPVDDHKRLIVLG